MNGIRFGKYLVFMMMTSFVAMQVQAQDATPDLSKTAVESNSTIDARTFTSIPKRQSKSGQVILFGVEDGSPPEVGKIVLLRLNQKPVIALRVLRSDNVKSEYIAKKVRRYDAFPGFETAQKFESIEKVSDTLLPPGGTSIAVAVPPPALPEPTPEPVVEAAATPEPTPELIDTQAQPTPVPVVEDEKPAPVPAPHADEDISTSSKDDVRALPFDKELDATTSPGKHDEPAPEEDKNPDEVEEVAPMFPYSLGIAIQPGEYLNSANFKTNGSYETGFGLILRMLLGRNLFAVHGKPQDRLLLELGIIQYTLNNWSSTNGVSNNDNYVLFPLRAELRYSLDLNQNLSVHLYGGFQYDLVTHATNGVAQIKSDVNGPQLTGGTGFAFHMGPSWSVLVDLGWDRLAAGLMLEW